MADIKKLEKELWEAADNLRANSKLTSQQYCMPVLGLIFLRYAWGRFKMADAQIRESRTQSTGRQIPIEAADYTKRGAMFIPEEARYDFLLNLPESEKNLGKRVDDAMAAIEKQNPQLAGVLPRNYTDLGDDLLAETLRIFNNPALDEDGDDIIGRIYEYFLGKFAPAVASDDGVFFTPKSLVRMIMNVIEPERGVMLDPACGSGGMFVSASDYVREHGGNPADLMTYYGQEKVEYNAKLCLMNMAVHGMNGRIVSGDEANTFYHDAHSLDGSCDYVAANPPFNVDKVKSEDAINAGRMPLGISGINKAGEFSNANYLWINYFYSYLNPTGRAGFVMASSATDSSGKDRALREKLVKSGHVDAMLYVGNNFFYTKSLPCTLWFLDKGKPQELRDKVLFIDAQSYHTAIDTTHNEWSPWQLKNLSAIVWLYRGEADKYATLLDEYSAAIREMAELADGDTKAVLAGVTMLDDFAGARDSLAAYIEKRRAKAKADVEAAKQRERKRLRAAYDEEIAELEDALTVVDEALWLTDRFGAGEYADVPGLCKIATLQDIEEKNWSLTPGAHVGVPPQEDDGVDFHERMGEIHEELLRLQAESNDLMATISRNFEELGL
ncbi:HsdM family class I SAM-dependent methyltransferase [Bifidobacterium merycicum]|uniref:site-specific DNA-methyltransferase (adenine-specific) n=1 Tax=Bifidobacterium merycicum TaxID=78345 RepID=A0A087BHH0_9BIFI|nr:class I SAM-dependent DNA methyltransferase [Bifidobacterium merycicum]KFI70470.1 N-6 DNA Methylase [Bifidobacterium merycicum]SHE48476.1 type I restriction enzyme M protein [Bifidobacterium merycicum DSM 6492]